MGGFECSTHRLRSGRRLDVIAATAHDRFALQDYRRLASVGMRTARDGLRWHLIEETPYKYDFSSVLPMLKAARQAGVQVIWDILHYGWPDDVDVFSESFIHRFASFARAFAEVASRETDGPRRWRVQDDTVRGMQGTTAAPSRPVGRPCYRRPNA